MVLMRRMTKQKFQEQQNSKRYSRAIAWSDGSFYIIEDKNGVKLFGNVVQWYEIKGMGGECYVKYNGIRGKEVAGL